MLSDPTTGKTLTDTDVLFTLQGYSDGPIGPWSITPNAVSEGADAPTPTLTLDQQRLGNGSMTTLHVLIPAGSPAGTAWRIEIYSYQVDALFNGWVGAVEVN